MEDVKDEVQSDLSKVMKALATDSKGVMVHASTLGALEALLQVGVIQSHNHTITTTTPHVDRSHGTCIYFRGIRSTPTGQCSTVS